MNQRRTELATVVAQHVKPIADQAFAALQARTPRPTDQDLATPATANQLAATVAEQEAAAAIAGIDKRIHELAANAATLEPERPRSPTNRRRSPPPTTPRRLPRRRRPPR